MARLWQINIQLSIALPQSWISQRNMLEQLLVIISKWQMIQLILSPNFFALIRNNSGTRYQGIISQLLCWFRRISAAICHHGWDGSSIFSQKQNNNQSGGGIDPQFPNRPSQWCLLGRWWPLILGCRRGSALGEPAEGQGVINAYSTNLLRQLQEKI